MTDPNMPGVLTALNISNKDTKSMAYEVVQAARAAGHQLYYVWGNGPTGDHKAGFAIDFMVYDKGSGVNNPGPERADVGRWIWNYIWDNRLRLGVRYEIYDHQIISRTGTPPNVPLPYTAMVNGKRDPHTNHVHVSRFHDARPYEPPPAPAPEVKPVDRWLSLLLEARAKEMNAPRTVTTHAATTNTTEKALKAWGFPGGLAVDGHYGTGTDLAVKWFQGKVSPGTTPDGILGPKEWATLSVSPQGKKLFNPIDGNYEKWLPAPEELWLSLLLEARATELHKAQSVTTHGLTVNKTEKALKAWGYPGPLTVDGHYGTSTEAAIMWFQKLQKAKVTGILTEGQWKKLGAGPAGSKVLFKATPGDYKQWI